MDRGRDRGWHRTGDRPDPHVFWRAGAGLRERAELRSHVFLSVCFPSSASVVESCIFCYMLNAWWKRRPGAVRSTPRLCRCARLAQSFFFFPLQLSAARVHCGAGSDCRVGHSTLSVDAVLQAVLKQPLTLRGVKAAFENLRGAVMIAYPAFHDLPTWDPARIILEEEENQPEGSVSFEVIAL